MWPKLSLFDAEPGAAGGSGETKTKTEEIKSDKIKVGDKEYDPKTLSSALTLYEGLQDETTGREIIGTLAQRIGLLDKSGEIKPKPGETPKETKSRAAERLKNKLGKEYSQFADSVGPVFDEIVEEYVNERLGEANSNSTQ